MTWTPAGIAATSTVAASTNAAPLGIPDASVVKSMAAAEANGQVARPRARTAPRR
ncbi:MAG: hypothetical protein IPQ07_06210 [Myxococcales bacterium]|nr:hypothetical protein [Myxococcales bacterium]